MSLAERFQPSLDQIVGNEKTISRVKKYIKNAVPCILYGEQGVGKTATVHAVAKELGMEVIESNASDSRRKEELQLLLRRVKMKSLTGKPTIFLLDEADGLKNGNLIEEIITSSKNPVVLTANDLYKIPKNVRVKCERIRFYAPRINDILKRVKQVAKKEGGKVSYDRITRDVRSSIISAVYGGDIYKTKSDFNDVSDVITGKTRQIPDNLNIWFLDNASSFYSGRQLYEAIKLICLAERSGHSELLKRLPRGRWGRVSFPHFLRRAGSINKK